MNENEIHQVLNILRHDREFLKAELSHLEATISRYEGKLLAFNPGPAPTPVSNPLNKINNTPFQLPIPGGIGPVVAELTKTNPAEDNGYPDFPKNESTEAQIIYLLNKIGRIVRLPFLQTHYNTAVSPLEKNIAPTIKRMKDAKTVVSAKFNNAWTSVFYGLPEWVETDENGNKTFKEQYRPTRQELPTGYNTINFDF